MMVTDMSIGCGLRRYTVQYIYQTEYSLPAYLKSWGDDIVIVIHEGHILGMVRRDKRPIWQKLLNRIQLYWRGRFPRRHDAQSSANEDAPSMADCCA
jgi:hypothetical protein